MNNYLFYNDYYLLPNGLHLKIPKVKDLTSPAGLYKHYLSIILFDEPDISPYEFLMRGLIDEEWNQEIVNALKWWLHADDVVRNDTNIIIGFKATGKLVPFLEEDLNYTRDIIKQFLQIKESTDEIEYSQIKFKNERQRELYRKREEARKKLEESRRKNNTKKGSGFTLGDFIIGVATMSNLKPDEINEFSVTYLYDYFASLQKREAFHIQVQQAMFAKKAELTFWLGG